MSKLKNILIAPITGIFAALFIGWLAAILTGCSRDYSKECQGCTTTTTWLLDGQSMGKWSVATPCDSVKADTSYVLVEGRKDIIVTVKTVCR